MTYYYSVPIIRGTYFKTYVARITCEDPTFRFKRRFLSRECLDLAQKRICIFDIGGHGVFEQCIRRFNRITNKQMSVERKWFVYYRRRFYEIDYDEVLFCVYNLKAQYWRWPAPPKAAIKVQEVA